MKHLELTEFLRNSFGESWYDVLKDHLHSDYFYALGSKINEEESKYILYPSKENRFRAFRETPFNLLTSIIIAQDPYATASAADGLCFSNSLVDKASPSLNNIFKELYEDIEEPSLDKDLSNWAKQGILMLNTALTVREGQPNSHKELWAIFTSTVIQTISEYKNDIVWMMWGNQAQYYKRIISNKTHGFVCTSHPSPLGAYHGDVPFIGSRCFSKFNNELRKRNKPEIIW